MSRPYNRHSALADEYPAIAAQWHPWRNGDLTPHDVTARSNRKVWWIDEHEHAWQAAIASRTVFDTACPVCCGRARGPENLLVVAAPEIAAQWHPTRNAGIDLASITLGSKVRAWWLADGREWQAIVQNRTRGVARPR